MEKVSNHRLSLNPSMLLWIESKSEYISSNVSSTKVKVYLHNVSGNVSIYVGSIKWENLIGLMKS